jgi:NDP-sugar pyrophosphorylase family protein
MRAILLCAGKGVRFRPVTDVLPKPLLPFLNVPVARAHLRRLHQAGLGEVAVNLHHLPDQIERDLGQQASDLPKLAFFHEPEILGTAGALRNAAAFLEAGGDDFLVVNADAAITPDYAGLIRRHRDSRRAATLLVTDNRHPDLYTPLQSEGDRITGFGIHGPRPLLYTGVCVLSSRLLPRIPTGETALVRDLWRPLLDEGEELGFVRHHGPHADLGRPGDFLGASLEALARGGPFPPGGGTFDGASRVLAFDRPHGFVAADCVLGRGRIGSDAALTRSVVWNGTVIGDGARLTDCLLARGRVAAGSHYAKALLWSPAVDTEVSAWPLSGLDRHDHRVQPLSPRR